MRPREVAGLVRMTEAELVEVNRIPPRMLVRQGSALVVRRTSPGGADVADHLADRARLALAPDAPARKAQPGQAARRPAAKAGSGGQRARAQGQAARPTNRPPRPAAAAGARGAATNPPAKSAAKAAAPAKAAP
jgi:membrane-bound lytic murein transglycosylase D